MCGYTVPNFEKQNIEHAFKDSRKTVCEFIDTDTGNTAVTFIFYYF